MIKYDINTKKEGMALKEKRLVSPPPFGYNKKEADGPGVYRSGLHKTGNGKERLPLFLA